MSGFHPLSPGVWLMRRLRLRGKLLLLAAASLLPQIFASALSAPAEISAWVMGIELGGAAVLVYLMLSFYVSFMSDFRQVLASMEETASGNLRTVLKASGNDELADLTRLLDRMVGNLSSMVAEVRSNSALVAHAGKSLATGNRDLADRTERRNSPARCNKTPRPPATPTSRPRRCATWRNRARSRWGARWSRWKASRRARSR